MSSVNLKRQFARATLVLWFSWVTFYSDTSFADAVSATDHGGSQSSACQISIDDFPSEVVIEYDPFLAGATTAPLSFRLLNESSSPCAMTVSVSQENALAQFEYQFAEAGVGIILNTESQGSRLTKTKAPGAFAALIPSASVTEYTLNIVVTEDAVASAADHLLPLNFDFKITDTVGSAAPNKQAVTLILRAKPRAQVNISGASGGFGEVGTLSKVDFGLAKRGALRRVFVQMRANTSSMLTIDSQHRGVLKFQGDDKLDSVIPYSAKLGDTEVDLSRGYKETFDVPKTFGGTSVPLELTLGDPAGAAAGRYADIITIEFSPL